MGSSTRQKLGREVWGLAAKQHGVVARRQLLELGLSAQAIQHRVERGRLHRIERGVYAVGRPELSHRGRWMAAVLGSGPRAALSYGSAAALWGVDRERRSVVEVSVPVTSVRKHGGVLIYRRPNLGRDEVVVRDGIPVTSVVRTLIDIAARLDRADTERAVNAADRLGLVDPEALAEALAQHPGKRGVGRLRDMLGARTFRLTDSELERRFLRLVGEVGLPIPLTRQYLNGFKVDFLWLDLRLVVETDGLRYHRTAAQQARDRLRDQAHLAAGFTPLRFTHAQVRYQAGYVRFTLLAVVNRLRRLGHATDA
ncbi:MAG TPA: type IV toxin-antitoxin system AbiEi family antitoxin domain-containing protein [Solirubrobacterales bacterium]|nr:type IV toxin-antitoxin system AbiEi family antitoxin domain-containing protein [Solirubrobacterales bacterium]